MKPPITREILEIIAERVIQGHTLEAIAKAAGVDRRTLWNWRQRPEFQEALLFKRRRLIDELRFNVVDMAFDKNAPHPTRLKATLELLKTLEPEDFDPRIRFQTWLDARDERIQAENAAKAMEQKVDEEHDPQESHALDVALAELMQRRRAAAALVAQEADDYEEAGE